MRSVVMNILRSIFQYGAQKNQCQELKLPVLCNFGRHEPWPRDYSLRSELGTLTIVTAYPSVGGIIVGYFSIVELQYLDISRTEDTKRSYDHQEKDDFAVRILRLGAHWWSSWRSYSYYQEELEQNNLYDYHFPPIVKVGYPSSRSGVWVLTYLADSDAWPSEINWQLKGRKRPEGWNKAISNVLTMDEQCEVLGRFGATFFKSIEDCDSVSTTIDQAVMKGQHYEMLLQKMEDADHNNQWYESI